MTLEQLHNKFSELNIPENYYYLHGLYGSTDDNDKLALTIRRGKYSTEYEIYFKERGEKYSTRFFTDETEACNYLFYKILDEHIFWKTRQTKGFSNMTLEEKFKICGIATEFYRIKNEDIKHAKNILKQLNIDRETIEQLLK